MENIVLHVENPLVYMSVLILALNLTTGGAFNTCVPLRSTRLSPFMKFSETLLTSAQSNTVCLQIRSTIWPALNLPPTDFL